MSVQEERMTLLVRSDQPLIGVIGVEHGQEVVYYFAEEKSVDAALGHDVTQSALGAIGAWSDLDWDQLEAALYQIRHETPPTPPIEL